MTTGERIKAARKAAGMTQKELGERLGLAFQSVAQWENDLRNPKIETLQRIADALGVHIFDLTGIGKELDKYVFELDESSLPPDISPSEKERIIALLKSNPRILYNALSDEEKEEFWKIRYDYDIDMDRAAIADIIREIGMPHGPAGKATVAETRKLLCRVAEIYGENAAILLRLTSCMDESGEIKVVEYAKSIFQEHIDRTVFPAESPGGGK